jgi:hypothetical protein
MKTGRQRPSADPASTRCLAAGPAADSAAAAGEEVMAAVASAAVASAAAVVSAARMAEAAEVGDPGEDSAADLEAEVAVEEEGLEEAGADRTEPLHVIHVMYHQSICTNLDHSCNLFCFCFWQFTVKNCVWLPGTGYVFYILFSSVKSGFPSLTLLSQLSIIKPCKKS